VFIREVTVEGKGRTRGMEWGGGGSVAQEGCGFEWEAAEEEEVEEDA
jgi:hypothetical protein